MASLRCTSVVNSVSDQIHTTTTRGKGQSKSPSMQIEQLPRNGHFTIAL